MEATWGDWLKAKRGRRGDPGFVSLEELAARLGVSRTRVMQIEALAEAPPYSTRQRIHAALGTTEDELIALGIVRHAHGYVRTGNATVRGGTVTATINEDRPASPAADAFIRSLSPDQRALLRRLLDAADVIDLAAERADDAAEPGMVREG